MRDNFDRIAEVMWNQVKQTIPRLYQGYSLTSRDVFGDTLSINSMPPFRRALLEAGIVVIEPDGTKMMLGDREKAAAFIRNPMAVAEILWPREAAEWKELMSYVSQRVNAAPVIPSKERPGAPLAVVPPPPASPVPVPPPAPAPPLPAVAAAAPEPSLDVMAEIEMAKVQLMKATAENMVYIRDRLDGLINTPPPELRPTEVRLVLVDEAKLILRLEAVERNVAEALAILREFKS